MNKKIVTFLAICITLFSIVIGVSVSNSRISLQEKTRFWDFQSVDTMKYSRDLAREKNNDSTFDVVIERQIKQIADVNATHVSIATPYDEEFGPFLKRWVSYARRYGLNVWFRGNFSGWEGWFSYDKIDRDTHARLVEEFILNNPGLFADGDVFSACPECENGGPGDPRHNNDAQGHKEFLIKEYEITKRAFAKIGKKVDTRFNSMNGDVAKLIMDEDTTSKLGGLVVVDHYVLTPEKLNQDVTEYALRSGGKVVLGEFGAPIPDIHGEMSEVEQNEWLTEAFELMSKNIHLMGMNYWTNTGGSTEVWEESGYKRVAVDTIAKSYSPFVFAGQVTDYIGKGLGSTINVENRAYKTDKDGNFAIPSLKNTSQATIMAEGYEHSKVDLHLHNDNIKLIKSNPSSIERLLILLLKIPLPF